MVPVTVLGNLSVDHVDDAPASPGGCPSFAGVALSANGGHGRVVARAADGDHAMFSPLLAKFPVSLSVLPADVTSAFSLRYPAGDGPRTLTVDAVGDPWLAGDIEAARVQAGWVHVAPLLRSDFPAATLAGLAASGCRVSYDGQGLVRVPRLGQLELDDCFDDAILECLTVLKLGEEEARIVARGEFDAAAASRLGVAETLVTFGAGGCDLYVAGALHHVPAVGPVGGVHATGAGDLFAVAYVASRARGKPPEEAALRSTQLVAAVLEARRAAGHRTA